jgi:hypothetical protein
MGERSEYTPGTFSWADLATTDQPAAKAFYGALFGWQADDMPIGDGLVYSMMKAGSKQVAGIGPQPEAQRDAGAPPAWNSYVSVVDADATVERVKELGGTAHAPAFDVFDAGRMAVLQDPQGAFFEIWQPRGHTGAQLVNAPGALAWNDLNTSDVDGAAAFYGELFGWTFTPHENSPEPYLVIMNGGRGNGGISALQTPAPPHWLPYFAVEEIDAALASVVELGGRTLAGPIEIAIAKIGIVSDPQGAVFAIYAGELEE